MEETANLVSEDFGTKPGVSCSHPDLRPSCVEHSCMGETAKVTPEKEANGAPVAGKDRLMTEELGNALNETVHIQDEDDKEKLFQDIYRPSNREGTSYKSRQYPWTEMHQASGSAIEKSLCKCATFPCSEKILPSPLPVEGDEMPVPSSMKPDNPACTRSNSLPASLKLVSALKGGREQQGTYLNSKLSVTWAPDVYDPPTTSLSHTVKSHNQHHRAKTKKKDHKHKHYKGKSTRGSSGSEKRQHVHKRNTGNTDTLHLRLQASADRILCEEPRKAMGQSTTEVVEFAVISQDSKCGGSFLRESLRKVNLPFAEAT